METVTDQQSATRVSFRLCCKGRGQILSFSVCNASAYYFCIRGSVGSRTSLLRLFYYGVVSSTQIGLCISNVDFRCNADGLLRRESTSQAQEVMGGSGHVQVLDRLFGHSFD